MVIPRLYHIVDLVCLAPVEIDVVVRFAQQLALNSGIEFVSGQSQQVHFFLRWSNSIFWYFLYILLNKVASLLFLSELVIIEPLHFNIIPIINEPSSLGSSSCRLLIGMLHLLHLLH